MKINHAIKVVGLAFAFVCMPVWKTEAQGWPATGWVNFNGHQTFGATTAWYGYTMTHPDVGLELDISQRTNQTWEIHACTTFSDLPNWYDDCMTAGILDGGYYTMGVGAYRMDAILSYFVYSSDWFIQTYSGTPMGDTFSFHWQEVEHFFCPWDWQWCMNGTGHSYRLISNITTYIGMPVTYYW